MSQFISDINRKRQRVAFLQAASLIYESICPPLARHLSSKAKKDMAASSTHDVQMNPKCHHCWSLLQPSRVRLQRRARIKQEIKRLKKRWDRPRGSLLTSRQHKKLRNWLNSKNVFAINCSTCHATSRYPCASRSARPNINQRSQSNASPMNPFVTPPSKRHKTNSKSQTPFTTSTSSFHKRTPARSSSSPLGLPGRNSRSAKKDKHRQLQRMLQSAKQAQQASTESPLSKFFTSL